MVSSTTSIEFQSTFISEGRLAYNRGGRVSFALLRRLENGLRNFTFVKAKVEVVIEFEDWWRNMAQSSPSI